MIEAIQQSGESRRDWLLWLFESAGKKNSNNENFQFWKNHNRPVELWSDKFIMQKVNYIHDNPVKAGIVDLAEEYRYSSAKNYAELPALLDVEVLNLWDGN